MEANMLKLDEEICKNENFVKVSTYLCIDKQRESSQTQTVIVI